MQNFNDILRRFDEIGIGKCSCDAVYPSLCNACCTRKFLLSALQEVQAEERKKVQVVLEKCIDKPELSKNEWEIKKRLINYIAGELEIK